MTEPPPQLTIHLVRHGQTDWNLNGRLQGWTDVPLNDTGIAQAQQAAQRLRGRPVGAVICSDLDRARATAAPIAMVLGLTPHPEPALRERNFGEVEGLTDQQINGKIDGELAAHWADPDFTFPAGETRREAYARIAAYLAQLLQAPPITAAAPELVLVSHGGALRLVAGYLEGVPVERLPPLHLANAEIKTVTVNPRRVLRTHARPPGALRTLVLRLRRNRFRHSGGI